MAVDPSRQSNKQMEEWQLVPGTRFYSPYPFAGMNNEDSPIAMADQEFYWIENFLLLGKGRMRTAWDVGTSIYTAPNGKTIVSFFFYTIALNYYCAVFLSDGSAVQINMSNLSTTTIGSSGFYSSGTGYLPACSQWGDQYLLISNRNTVNDYWAWDGSLLYTTGTLGPLATLTSPGSSYSTAPTVTISGGSGSGATASAAVANGVVTGVQITDPGSGYLLNDILTVSFSGGGSDTTATATATVSTTTSIVTGVLVLSGGTSYTTAALVTFTGGGGSGAEAVISGLTNGVITGITVTQTGSGYTSPPTIAITGGTGSGATFQVQISSGGVTAVNLTNAGTGYSGDPTVSIIGDGQGAEAFAVVTGNTGVASVTVTFGGVGYHTAPTVSFSGGGGTGATATAHISGGQVTSVSVTDAGSGYTSAPTVNFSGGSPSTGASAVASIGGGGLSGITVTNPGFGYTHAAVQIAGGNRAASATVALMPFGVSGAELETFQSRVWIGNPAVQSGGVVAPGGVFSVSAPGSLMDFATSDGGLIYVNSDRFLQTQYVNIRQSNGYLYVLGDGSVSVISSVSTTGSPLITTFNYQNVDPQAGLAWRDSIADFGRTIVFGNPTGIYGLYGGSVAKISKKLDQLFTNAIFPPTANAITPSAAVATLFNVKHYMMLMTIHDPDLGEYRNVMATWNEKDWVLTSQGASLTYIGTQKVSSVLYAWGTDGTKIYPLFNQPSATLTKRLDTKFYGGDDLFMIKQVDSIYAMAQDNSTGHSGVSLSAMFNVSGQAVQDENFPSTPSGIYDLANSLAMSSAAPPTWPVYGAVVGNEDFTFVTISARLSSTSPDFTLANFALSYQYVTAIR